MLRALVTDKTMPFQETIDHCKYEGLDQVEFLVLLESLMIR
jgi:hypothetical protein